MSEPTTIESVAELRSWLRSGQDATGVIVNASDFELHTEKFAQFSSSVDVLLWSGADLDAALNGGAMVEGLRQKLKYANGYGIPLYPLEELR